MLKLSKIVPYGNPMSGQSWFDDETSVPIIRDPDTGEDYSSLFVAGVNSIVNPNGQSTSPAHTVFSKKHMPYVSEFVSNSIGHDKEALKAYMVRYAKSMKEYKDKHGHYPKQRIIGHSRGGGGALEIMEALAREHPELPRVDEYVGLDPYDTPFARDKGVKRPDRTFVARKSFIVRPKRPGALVSDGSDLNGDGRVSGAEKLYSHFANLLVQFGRRMNPFSRRKAIDVAIPGANHSSAAELMDAYLAVRKARTRREAMRMLKERYGVDDSAMMATTDSPEYGVTRIPKYVKAASILARGV